MTQPISPDRLAGEALKACPFCGGEAQRMTIGEDEPNNAGGDVIVCTQCQTSSYVEFGRKENLVSRWNARIPPPSALDEEVVAVLREVTDLLTRYRNETPLGHSPHMIYHVADEAIVKACTLLARVKDRGTD